MKSPTYYFEYFLGFIVIFSIMLITSSFFKTVKNLEHTNTGEYSTEQNREAVQEIEDLKMTVSTFEAVISTLEADNQKLSEIIQKQNSKIGGWPLFGLLLLTSGLSAGLVFLNINFKIKGILND